MNVHDDSQSAELDRRRERLVSVFTVDNRGGNPAPIVLDARELSDGAMRAIAEQHGYESAFVLPPDAPDTADLRLRFFLPTGEVEMCGHATIGALWLLKEAGVVRAGRLRVQTQSGGVAGWIADEAGKTRVEISQPRGTVEPLSAEHARAVLDVLGLERDDVLDLPMLNAATSRVKTLVPMRSVARLNALAPRLERMKSVCEAIGSTGLYPFAASNRQELPTYEARQFPRASGYPEDAATGIAATALAFGLRYWNTAAAASLGLHQAEGIVVLQGRAMGRLSRIVVRFEHDPREAGGCRLGGDVAPM